MQIANSRSTGASFCVRSSEVKWQLDRGYFGLVALRCDPTRSGASTSGTNGNEVVVKVRHNQIGVFQRTRRRFCMEDELQ